MAKVAAGKTAVAGRAARRCACGCGKTAAARETAARIAAERGIAVLYVCA